MNYLQDTNYSQNVLSETDLRHKPLSAINRGKYMNAGPNVEKKKKKERPLCAQHPRG